MISLTVPYTNEDKNLLIDMAVDYTDEQITTTRKLPSASLITADTATLVVRRNGRPIGALSTATGENEKRNLRSEIHAIYLLPKWRNKGYADETINEFSTAAPFEAFLRGPLPDTLTHIAHRLEIPTAPVNDITLLDMVTAAFFRTVGCKHNPTEPEDPCRPCISGALRYHFTRAYDAMIARIEGDPTA